MLLTWDTNIDALNVDIDPTADFVHFSIPPLPTIFGCGVKSDVGDPEAVA